jgi:hypothetical protein
MLGDSLIFNGTACDSDHEKVARDVARCLKPYQNGGHRYDASFDDELSEITWTRYRQDSGKTVAGELYSPEALEHFVYAFLDGASASTLSNWECPVSVHSGNEPNWKLYDDPAAPTMEVEFWCQKNSEKKVRLSLKGNSITFDGTLCTTDLQAITRAVIRCLKPQQDGGHRYDPNFVDELRDVKWAMYPTGFSHMRDKLYGLLHCPEALETFLDSLLYDAPDQEQPYAIWTAPPPHRIPFEDYKTAGLSHDIVQKIKQTHFPPTFVIGLHTIVQMDDGHEKWGIAHNGMLYWVSSCLENCKDLTSLNLDHLMG